MSHLEKRQDTRDYEEVANVAVGGSKALESGLGPHEIQDIVIVDWDGPNDPKNPRNWSFRKKWAVTTVVSAYTFITPISSSMIAPAAQVIGLEFKITSDVTLALIVSIFVLAFAFGPLFLGPLSEIYGRVRVLQLSNLFYLVFNLACGFCQNTSQMIIFRLLSGLGGSAPITIGGAVIGDCWPPEKRGQAVGIYSLAPVLGPVLGPIVSSWITEKANWRWVFWSTSIFTAFIQIIGFIVLRETFPPVLLERKAQRLRIDMGLKPEERYRVKTCYESDARHWRKIFSKALSRPFVIFFHEPIIQSLGVYMAFVYGIIYIVLTTIPGVYQGVYGESAGTAGLHYIALGIGLTGASQINARLLDRIYKYLIAKNGGEGKPEYRLPTMFPGALFLPIGLLIFGWTSQAHVYWLLPDIGLAFIGAGIILVMGCIQNYVIDAFTLHAASALAAVTCLRSLAGFGFPLFAPVMYNALGHGKGDTVLAAFAIAGLPAPILFWLYGERIRQRSRYINAR